MIKVEIISIEEARNMRAKVGRKPKVLKEYQDLVEKMVPGMAAKLTPDAISNEHLKLWIDGGDIYTTALHLLTLQVYYRYIKLEENCN